jgi:hypothetical protein
MHAAIRSGGERARKVFSWPADETHALILFPDDRSIPCVHEWISPKETVFATREKTYAQEGSERARKVFFPAGRKKNTLGTRGELIARWRILCFPRDT